MDLHPSILSSINSRWCIFKYKKFMWIYRATLLTNKFVMSYHIVILKPKLKELQWEETMYRANRSFHQTILSTIKVGKEHLRDGYTSNLLEAARNISGDGLPCLTSGSSPRTTWCINEKSSPCLCVFNSKCRLWEL